MAARDERLVHADRDVLVAAELVLVAVERELDLAAVGALPDEPRGGAHGPALRVASVETGGPSLSISVASLSSAAAR